MAFDRHMNLVLGDAEEFRKLPPKKGVPEDEVRRPPLPVLLDAAASFPHVRFVWVNSSCFMLPRDSATPLASAKPLSS